MLNSGKINILTLMLSEKKIYPPPLQVKWSVPNLFFDLTAFDYQFGIFNPFLSQW